jgi:hypothetical protein
MMEIGKRAKSGSKRILVRVIDNTKWKEIMKRLWDKEGVKKAFDDYIKKNKITVRSTEIAETEIKMVHSMKRLSNLLQLHEEVVKFEERMQTKTNVLKVKNIFKISPYKDEVKDKKIRLIYVDNQNRIRKKKMMYC